MNDYYGTTRDHINSYCHNLHVFSGVFGNSNEEGRSRCIPAADTDPNQHCEAFLRLSRGRQKYLVGRTKLPPYTVYHKLVATGYQWDYFAYNDDGEQVSMRKLYSDRQVHVRAFDDGTIRMHDEFNYEIEPVRHLQVPLVPASRVEIEAVIAALEGTPEIDSKEYDTPIEYVMKRLGEKYLPTG